VLLAVGLWGAVRVEVETGNERLFLEGDPARLAQERFRTLFGGDELAVLALEGDIFTEDGLQRLDDLTLGALEVDGVADAVSITTAQNVYQGPFGFYGWAPYEWLVDPDAAAKPGAEPWTIGRFRREVIEEPLFRDSLISRDGRLAAVLVRLDRVDGEVIGALEELAAGARGQGFEVHLTGFPVQRVTFARLIEEDQRSFVPMLVLAIALLTLFFFRHAWGVVVPLATVGLAVAVTLGLAHALGTGLNMITSLLTPTVMVVSVTMSVNLLSTYTYKRERFGRGAVAIGAAYRRVGLACLFTTLTTVFGFSALAFAGVPAIRDFGALAAAGIAFAYIAALLLLPPLCGLRWRHGPQALRMKTGWIEAGLDRVEPWVLRHRWLVLFVTGALAVLSVVGMHRLRIETDILALLPEGSGLRSSTRAVDAQLGGVNALELLLEGPPGTFRKREALSALWELSEELRAERERGIGGVFSPADLVARLDAVARAARTGQEASAITRALPADPDTPGIYLGMLRLAGESTPLPFFLSEDASTARLSVRVREMGSGDAYALIRDVTRRARQRMPAGVTVHPAGQYVLLQNMTHALPRNQLRGLALAVVLIVLSIGVLFRSPKMAALAAAPAVLPVVWVYGIMGWSGVPLSTATTMIAAVVIGLAVDSTILFLSRYQDERREGADPDQAALAMLRHAGRSVSYSNLTLVAGFATCALSGFPPVRTFGVLTALTIGLSYLTAVFLLPALVRTFDRGA
jgi:predicted RND superfamily exporter protein